MIVSLGTGTTAKAWAGNDAMQRGEADVIEAVMLNLLDYATRVAEIEVDLMKDEPSMDQALVAGLGKTTEEGKMLIRIYEHLKLTGEACWDMCVILKDTNSARKELLDACLRAAQAEEKCMITCLYYAFEIGKQDYNNDTSRTEKELRQIADMGIKDVDYTVQSLRENAEQPIFDLFFDKKSPKLINQAADGLEEMAAAMPDSWYTYQMGYATAKAQDDRDPAIKISMKNTPKGELPVGKVFPVKGKITSEFIITEATVSLVNSKGKVVQTNTIHPNKKSVDIAGDDLDKLRFKKLTVGEYTFVLEVENKAGTTKRYESDFSVVEPEKPAHKHEDVIDPAVEATCTDDGKTEGKHCSTCDAVLVKQEVIPATGHMPELKNEANVTCTLDGYTGDEVCKSCGEIINEGEIIKAVGHKWDDGKVIKEATETAEGIKQFTCSVCNGTKDETIPVIDHKHSFKASVVKPSCTEDGYTLHKCVCGESYKDSYTDAKGHSYADGKCTVCGAADPNYKEPTPPAGDNPFTDIPDNAWYAAPVLWAKENNVTGGTSPTTFGPDDSCTRAQVVTFLWAANGRPDPISMNNPFEDVSDAAWYCKAVMWAVEQGITTGISTTEFGPNNTCTRAQIATFLYAAAGKPEVKGSSIFDDVADDAWYAKPIIWAAENEVTGGIGEGKFGPNNTCTRAQVVTFLYKVYG